MENANAEIITIISPTRNHSQYEKFAKELTDTGNLVFTPILVETTITTEYKKALMKVHRTKIDVANTVVVFTVDGYMGDGTYEEIGYATVKNKTIEYVDMVGGLL